MSNHNDSEIKSSKDSDKNDIKFGFKFKYNNKIKNMEGILMRKMKKFVSLAVTLSLLSSLVAPAFAASNTDVVGTQFEDAVTRMNALGILGGYPDGTFKPENNITRAEFAKIAVYMLGKQDAAALAAGTTKFKDVAGSNWAAGVINVATNEGIIKGYPDGSFKPEANVSYAEAITILVRALGLAPVVEGKGAWPANYMSKASSLGILDGVSNIGGNDKAIRGNIAKLGYNTMLENKWGETSYNDKGEIVYGELHKSLLSDKYGDFAVTVNSEIKMKVLNDATIIATKYNADSMNESIKVKVADEDQLNGQAVTFNGSDEATIKVDKSFSQAGLLGKKADIVLGKDNKVVSIKLEASQNKEGLFEKYDSSKNQITVNGVKYDLAANPTIILNNVAVQSDDTALEISDLTEKRDMVSITLNDDNKVEFINATRADAVNQDIVKEIKSNGNILTARAATFNDSELKDANTIFVKNGKEVSRNEIKVGDIIVRSQATLAYNGGSADTMDDNIVYTITDSKVTGKVTDVVKGTVDASAYRLTINGKSYEMANGAIVSTNGKLETSGSVADVLDMLNKDVTVSLNANGNIAFVNSDATVESGLQYGMVTKAAWDGPVGTDGKQIVYVKILASNGEEKIYQVTGDKLVNKTIATIASLQTDAQKAVDATNLALGTVVQFKVGADGKLAADKLTLLAASDIGTAQASITGIETNLDTAKLAAATGNDTLKSIAKGGINYFIGADTKIINSNVSANPDILELVPNFDAINSAGTPFSGDAYVVFDHNTRVIKLLVVDQDTYQTSTDKYGSVTQAPFLSTNSDGDKVWKVKVYSEGQESTYELSMTLSDFTFKAGDMIDYKLTEGKMSDADLALAHNAEAYKDLDNENGTVKQLSGNLVIFNGTGTTVVTDKDTVVYDLTGATPKMSSVNAIQAGQMVESIDTDNPVDGIANILVIVK